MRLTFLAFLVFYGVFLITFAVREMKLGEDKQIRKLSYSVVDARLASERSPYMRTEQ